MKEERLKERENRYNEVQKAYDNAESAKKNADVLLSKFIEDYPDYAFKGGLCIQEVTALQKAVAQLFGY